MIQMVSTIQNGRSIRIHNEPSNTIFINGNEMVFDEYINGVAFNDHIILILLYHMEPDGSVRGNKTHPNNVFAYDYNGNRLWSIADIIGTPRFPMGSMTIHTKESLEEIRHPWINENTAIEEHDYLCCSDDGGIHFIIDITEKKVLDSWGSRG